MNQENIPSYWLKVRFGEVCSLRVETVQPKNLPSAYYVGLEHIDTGIPELTRWGIASQVDSAKLSFYTGDVLYGKLRPYLDKAALAKFDGICSTDILVFNTSEKMPPEYLAYLVHTSEFLSTAVRTTRGVNHPRTSWASLTAFEFFLPPLLEQRAIAKALLAAQEAKKTRQQELACEQERKAALMQELFIYGTRGEPRKKTPIGELPQSWRVVRLGDKGVAHTTSGGTPNRSNPNYYGGDIPWVKSGELVDNLIHDAEEKITWQGLKDSSAKIFPPGTLLVAMYGATAGRTGILAVEAATNQAVCAIFPEKDSLNGYFLQYYLIQIRPELLSARSGGAQPNINQRVINNLQIPLPSIAEQREIACILRACDAKISALEREIELLDELFHAMLEELMTGRLSAVPLIDGEEHQ
ncbi:MAG: restriction endonuclease subunit S [Firmicutes bacterium]|nr:restriction endonuclease subunit S [Bacillota bacterium]